MLFHRRTIKGMETDLLAANQTMKVSVKNISRAQGCSGSEGKS